jgi:hypothetical protein
MIRFFIPIKKRLSKVWEPFTARETEPYPDQAGLYMSGDGNGFSMMSALYSIFSAKIIV